MNPRQRLQAYALHPAVLPVLLAAVAGSVYLATLLPGIGNSGDTAKFQFIGRYLGTPHPTGYPTYILLNHVFTLLVPVGSVAYRANLLSAVFAIGALLFLFQLLLLLGVPRGLSLVAALAFAFTPTFWTYALVAEVYSLHALFVSAVCYLFVRWHQTRRDRDFLLACAVYAFSFGNHLTTLWLLPAVAVVVWTTDRRVFTDRRKIGLVAGFILLSALQYGYIVWRTFDPKTVYLEMSAPDLKTFWWFVSGANFKAHMFSFSLQHLLLRRVPLFAKLLIDEFGLLLLVAGLGVLRFRAWRISLFLGLVFAGNAFYALNYDIADILPYFIPSFLIVAVYLGLGLKAVGEWLTRRRAGWLQAGLALIPLAAFWLHLGAVDQHNRTAKITETLAVLKAAQSDALILVPDYDVYEYLMYYTIAEGWRGKGIYVAHEFQLDGLTSYLEDHVPYPLPLERRDAPPDLTVYLAGVHGEPELAASAGFKVVEVKRGLLYRVSP